MTISQCSPLTLVAGEALEAYRLVYINSSGNAMYATANIRGTHYTLAAVASGARVACEALESGEVAKITAAAALSVGGNAYGAASGKVSSTSGGINYGKVYKAAFADGDYASVTIGAGPELVNYYNVTQAAGLTLTVNDSGCIVTNVGASGAATVTLPTDPPTGTFFRFFVSAAQELRVLPGAGNKIVGLGALAPSDAEYVTANANGEHLNLLANSSGDWQCVGYSGTWTEQTP